jgi:acylphosphatase
MVGFRYFVLNEARALGLTGWVRNREDGSSVEVVAQGDGAGINRLAKALQAGPPGARVDRIDVIDAPIAETYSTFEVRG